MAEELTGYIDRLVATAEAAAVEIGYPADLVGEEFAAIVRMTILGSDDGVLPARDLLSAGWSVAQKDAFDVAVAAVAAGDVDALRAALEVLGDAVAAGIRQVLERGDLPPIEEATIRRKNGERRPLVTAGSDRFRTLLKVRLIK